MRSPSLPLSLSLTHLSLTHYSHAHLSLAHLSLLSLILSLSSFSQVAEMRQRGQGYEATIQARVWPA